MKCWHQFRLSPELQGHKSCEFEHKHKVVSRLALFIIITEWRCCIADVSFSVSIYHAEDHGDDRNSHHTQLRRLYQESAKNLSFSQEKSTLILESVLVTDPLTARSSMSTEKLRNKEYMPSEGITGWKQVCREIVILIAIVIIGINFGKPILRRAYLLKSLKG